MVLKNDFVEAGAAGFTDSTKPISLSCSPAGQRRWSRLKAYNAVDLFSDEVH